jgi:polyhydroxyalkanoate synthesis regulator protein
MEMFQEALRVWMPFQAGSGKGTESRPGKSAKGSDNQSELEALRQQLKDMQKTIDSIAGKE